MKKYASILLCLALVVAAGGGKQTAPETLPETTEAPTTLPTETTEPPTEPLPKTEPVTVLADKTPGGADLAFPGKPGRRGERL